MTKRSAIALRLPLAGPSSQFCLASHEFLTFLTTRLPISWLLAKYHSEMKCFFVQYFDSILCFLYCCWIVIDSPHKPRELQCTTVSKRLRDGQVLRDTCPPKCSSNAIKWVKVRLLQSNPASQILNSVHRQNFMGKRMLNTINLTHNLRNGCVA